MELLHRVPLAVLLPVGVVVMVLPALLLDLGSSGSTTARALSLAWVLGLAGLLGTEVSRRRRAAPEPPGAGRPRAS